MSERRQPAYMSLSEWSAAYDRLSSHNPATLERADLELLSDASFWLGHPRESNSARERVYAVDRDANDAAQAAISAWRLFYGYFDLDETAVAHGWLKRAEQHVADQPGMAEEGYVSVAAADWALFQGRFDEATARAEAAVSIGRRHRDRDLVALGQAVGGRIHVQEGDVAVGIALLDEAMVAAVNDELSPFMTGNVYCVLLYTCEMLGDLRRAAEWSDLAVRWSDRHGHESGYPGMCRLHRCAVQSLRGEWELAEREAIRATEELAAFAAYLPAEGWYLVGEIRRRKGADGDAEEAFHRAYALGRDPQPGMALLRLARGDADSATRDLRVALATPARGPLHRAQLLGAYVEALLETGDTGTAIDAARSLDELATTTNVAVLNALAAHASALIQLDAGDAEAAIPLLREACAVYRESSCPYEVAKMRFLTGIAARRAGDSELARLEFDAAASAFENLGAVPDARRAAELAQRRSTRPNGLTEREVDVLRLVAHGKSNREIAATLVISEHTVARHLSNIFRKLTVSSRSAAAAFAFEHNLT